MERRTFLAGTVAAAAAGGLTGSSSSVGAQNAATPAAPKVAFHVDLKKTPESAEIKTHNRWHPDIPMVETFKPGAEFRVECFDWTGGQIAPDNSANDVRDVNLTKVHYLSGPFGVEGAEPGDLLVVDVLDIG